MDNVSSRLLVLFLFLLSCGPSGSGPSQGVPQDVGDVGQADSDSRCVPDCSDRECGGDGCGGTCGSCPGGKACDWLGVCVAVDCEGDDDCEDGTHCHPGMGVCTGCVVHSDCGAEGRCVEGECVDWDPCDSSLDCEGDLVCDADAGVCVDCAGHEDCEDGSFCGGDGQCWQIHLCDSDKDCKELVMVCNKSEGLCVDCLAEEDCPSWEHCLEATCVTDLCLEGDAHCLGDQVVACDDTGAAWELIETCTADEYCEDALCHEMLCTPETRWCEGMVQLVCDAIGKEIASEQDCEVQGLFCLGGECVDVECAPGSVFCADDFTLAECALDGMSATEEACPSSSYCQDGLCHPWNCEPGVKQCLGQVASQCNQKGSVLVQVDCAAAGQGCKDGECLEYACDGGTSFCVDSFTVGQCTADGFSFDTSPCPAQHFCSGGLCLPWQCEPGSKGCEGEVAVTCAEDGSDYVDAIDCSLQGEFCLDGVCVDCIASCAGKICGDDGCGGSCGICTGAQDVCIGGMCLCQPDCIGKLCGGDGCGGSCGSCPGPQDACVLGQCVCLPSCDGLDCGPDGCGGSCGACAPGQFCVAGACPPPGKTCEDGNDEPWDGCSDNDVTEFFVDPAGHGENGIVLSVTPDGGYVAAWVSVLAVAQQVMIQRFYADGAPTGPAVPVHPNTVTQVSPAVTTLTDGRILVAWEAYGGCDGDGKGIQARVLLSNLSPSCDAFIVNAITAGDQQDVAVAALEGGQFVAAWDGGEGQDGSGLGVFARVFDSNGDPVTDEFPVNSTTYASQHGARVAPLGSGFVSVWNSILQDGSSGGIFGQRFDDSWEPEGDEFQVNLVTSNNQRDPSVAASSGGFSVVWESNQQDGSGWGVFRRRFDVEAAPLVDDLLVNEDIAGDQGQATMACTADGACVYAWRDLAEPCSEIRYRRVDPVGSPVIATEASCVMVEMPSAALQPNGGLILAWTGTGYAEGTRVLMRRFDSDDMPLYH